MKKCAEIKKKGMEIDNEFKKFVDGCFCPKTFDRKAAEFRRIKTKIQLGLNKMDKSCVKEKCPSDFCLKLYDEIMKEVPKME